jgi:Holliday junction resolvasome RuvABC endonuclease subunit
MIAALDLSYNSSGIAIADTEQKLLYLSRLDITKYDFGRFKNKYEHMFHNSMAIANAIAKLMLPFRSNLDLVLVESVVFNLRFGNNNSVLNLVMEGGIVASKLYDLYGTRIEFIQPKTHKKAFTGTGNASKECSVRTLLTLYPNLAGSWEKMDDVADAVSLLSTVITDLQDYRVQLVL